MAGRPIIYIDDVTKYSDPVVYASEYARMPSYRKEKTDRFRFDKDKRLSLGAGVLLMRAAEEAGVSVPDAVCEGENGKPYFPGCEDIFRFSLSHSEDKVMCAVFRGPLEVGCDIEKIRDANTDIAKRYFSANEYDEIMSCESPEERSRAFFRLWTLKESFMKATGLGFSLPLSEFEIVTEGERISVRQSVNSRDYEFGFRFLPEGYACAWCIEE